MMKHLQSILMVALLCFGATAYASAPKPESPPSSSIAEFSLSSTDVDEQVLFTFYPNPVKNVLNVKFKAKGTYTIRVFNVVGVKVKEQTVEDAQILSMDVTDLHKGVYFISYEPGNGKVITKTFSKDQ